nr:hypothetical protein [Streptomyces sp. Z423-1]
MAGHWGLPKRQPPLMNGWHRSGDVARLDGDGDGDGVDRKEDLIISGGENVHPAEVEDQLLDSPDNLRAARRRVGLYAGGESPHRYDLHKHAEIALPWQL